MVMEKAVAANKQRIDNKKSQSSSLLANYTFVVGDSGIEEYFIDPLKSEILIIKKSNAQNPGIS